MNVNDLRKAAKCIYVAAHQDVAIDIDKKIQWAANRIETLEQTAMTEEKAREIFGKEAQLLANIELVHGYTPDELEAIAWWMRNKRANETQNPEPGV